MAANNQIAITITAKDQASKVLDNLGGNVKKLSSASAENAAATQRMSGGWGSAAAGAAVAGGAIYGFTNILKTSLDSANQFQAALLGLTSVARAFGTDVGQAKQAAQSLAADGLMTVSDAATGLKNLLASGFSLDESVNLMNAFKDSAAFGRQAALGFGESIRGATEGIKNGNSILVDNAGVTKNLSVILKEMGKSEQDVMNVTSDATVRQALYNGILRETAAQSGDAAKLTQTFAGEQARAAAEVEKMRQTLGGVVQMVTGGFLQAFTDFLSKNQQAVISLGAATAAVAAFGGGLFLAINAIRAFSAASLLAAATNPLILALTALAAIAGVVVYKAVDKMQAKVNESNGKLGEMGDTLGKRVPQQSAAASKAMGDLQKKLADIDEQIVKANRDFRENLAEMIKSHQDKVAGLQKQLAGESADFKAAYDQQTKDFKAAQAEMEDEYHKKTDEMQAALEREQALGEWADQNRIYSLQKRIGKEKEEFDKQLAERQAKYDEDVARDRAAHEKKQADLQAQLDAETSLLNKHAADVASIRAVTLLDEVDKLKRSHDEQLAAFQKQKDAAIGNAAQTAAGVSGVWNSANAGMNAQFAGMGSSLGKAMGEAFKQALVEVFVDTGKKVAATLATLGTLMSPVGLINLIKNKGNVGKTIDDQWKAVAGALGGDKLIYGRASGGPVAAGRPYVVGEQGPELVVPRQSGTVIPAPQTAAMLGGRGGNVTVHNNIYNQVDMDAMLRDLSWRMRLA